MQTYETPKLTTYGTTLNNPTRTYVIDNINKHFDPQDYAPPVGQRLPYDDGSTWEVTGVTIEHNNDTGRGYHRVVVTQRKVK